MNLKNLETEQRNPRTMHIDSMSTLDMVRTVNQEDAAVTQAVETALPDIARLIDGICERLQNGGSLYYIGSTRMKAGTAQKLILNMLSTCTMIKLGKVYQNLMVDVRPSNEKLVERSLGILQECTGCDRERATALLHASDYHVKTAVLMALADLSAEQAQEKLTQADGRLATALKS